jgi:ADP-heptose:LPS heptosyltransferase
VLTVKIWLKKNITDHPFLPFLLPAGQFVLGIPCRLRNVFFREILRLRLVGLRLIKRQPLMLFVRYGGIGDILCSLPAYQAACRANPKAHGVFITLTEFQCLPVLARVPGSVCPSRVHCSIPKFPRWFVAQVFSPHYTDELGRQGSSAHLIDEFFHACGLAPTGIVPRFCVPPGRIKKIRKLLHLQPGETTKMVVIHPGPSWKVREWPVAHWQALVDGLRASSVRILQIGAHRHVTMGVTGAATLLGVESLVDQLSLEDMAALLTVADLFIGIDSGMIHMAGAAGTPCVGIFGPTNPAFRMLRHPNAVGLFHSLPCSFCHHRHPRLHFQSGCPHGIACMNMLKPELVLEQSLGLLASSIVHAEKMT